MASPRAVVTLHFDTPSSSRSTWWLVGMAKLLFTLVLPPGVVLALSPPSVRSLAWVEALALFTASGLSLWVAGRHCLARMKKAHAAQGAEVDGVPAAYTDAKSAPVGEGLRLRGLLESEDGEVRVGQVSVLESLTTAKLRAAAPTTQGRMRLVLSDRTAPIDGPAIVLSGHVHTLDGRTVGTRPLDARTLDLPAEVVVEGQLVRLPNAQALATGYRDAEAPLVIRPLPGHSAAYVRSVVPATLRVTQPWLPFVFGLWRWVALLVTHAAIVPLAVASNRSVAECRDGVCAEAGAQCTLSGAVGKTGLVACAVPPDACEQSSLCRDEGRCTQRGNDCVADSRLDCRTSTACAREGRCDPAHGRCIAAAHFSCVHLPGCELPGQCIATDGRCEQAYTDDCTRSPQCRSDGMCRTRDGRCSAATEMDCVWSEACVLLGKCSIAHGMCIERQPKAYAETNDVDCPRSRRCATDGLCTRVGPTCLSTTDESCQASVACITEGRCFAREGRCVAISDRECAASLSCLRFRKCSERGGSCVSTDASCTDSRLCWEAGLCGGGPSNCVARTDQDCAGSSACREKGQCVERHGRCVVNTER